jgi:hypothetical protein
MALGDEAASEKNWGEADPLYRQALELAKKANDAKSQETAKTRLAQAIYRQAVDQYGARDMEKTLALCGELVRDNPDHTLAEDASAVAIAAALALYGEAANNAKEAALARLDKVANYALTRWPNKPVSDDARMAMAQVALMKSDYPAALERLGQVNVQSKRYPTALQVLGQVKWKQYLTAKKAPDAEKQAGEIAKLREEAVTNLKTSLERQRASWQSGSEPMPPALFDTQLLLAEVHLEGQQYADAAPLFEALVELMKSAKPTTVDRSGQRALIGAVRAWLATGNVGQAADAALTLIAISHDEEQPNSVLVELAKLVGQEMKKAGSPAPTEQTTLAAAPKADPLRDLLGRLVDALAPRTALSVPQLIYIGDACLSLDRSDKAREVYQRLLAMIDKDESAKATAGAAVTGIRARLVGLLRSEGKLDEANQQVDALIKEHPKALEPLMEKGYILQSLAQQDSKRYDECIAHWTNLRVRMGASKARPPEYYEALYNAAWCLIQQARQGDKKKAQEKAQQAEQMLKSTLTLTPKLSGPDLVAKYEALLGQAVTMRGEAPAPAGPGGKR